MRLHGYCERCHRPRLVNVRYALPGTIPIGICDECEDRRVEARRPRIDLQGRAR